MLLPDREKKHNDGEGTTSTIVTKTPIYLLAAFSLFGLAQLLPWNIYTKSVPYFRSLLAGSDYAGSVASFMSSGFTLANMGTMLIIVLLRWDEYLMQTRGRILLGMSANTLIMASMAVIPVLSLPQPTLFVAIVSCSALAGASSAFMIKGLLGMVSKFPPSMTPWLLAGQAAAGLLVSTVTLVSTLTFKVQAGAGSASLGPILYFVLGALVMFVSVLVLLTICMWSPFFRHYMGLATSQRTNDLIAGDSIHNEHRKTPRTSFSLVWVVLGRIRWFALGICATLAVTISVYATFTTAPRLQSPYWGPASSLLYVPLVFLVYDVGDMVGRWLPTVDALNPSYRSKKLKVLPWMRFALLLPIFVILAPVNITGHEVHRPLISLPDGFVDAVYVLSTFILAVSNGYCCTTLLMHAPSQAISHDRWSSPDSQHEENTLLAVERESCGALMGLFLNIGLVLGSLSSFLWRALLR